MPSVSQILWDSFSGPWGCPFCAHEAHKYGGQRAILEPRFILRLTKIPVQARNARMTNTISLTWRPHPMGPVMLNF